MIDTSNDVNACPAIVKQEPTHMSKEYKASLEKNSYIAKCQVRKVEATHGYDELVITGADGSIVASLRFNKTTGDVQCQDEALRVVAVRHLQAHKVKRERVRPREKCSPYGVENRKGRNRPNARTSVQNKDNDNNSSSMPLTGKPEKVVHFRDPQSEVPKKGDFFIERCDYFGAQSYPIYRLEYGNIILMYENFVENGCSLHRPTRKYTSFVREHYKRVDVQVLKTESKVPLIVKVDDDFERTAYDNTLEGDQLAEIFTIYLQALMTRSMKIPMEVIKTVSDFSSAIKEIEILIMACQEEILSDVKWNETLKTALDLMPFIEVKESSSNPRTDVRISISGNAYDPESLDCQFRSDCHEFQMNKTALDPILTYHALKHFKYNLFLDCSEENQYLRNKMADKDDIGIMDTALNNLPWIQHWMQKLKILIEKTGIAFTVGKFEIDS